MGANDPITKLTPSENEVLLRAGQDLGRHLASPRKADVLHGMPFVVLRDEAGKERVEYVTDQFINPTFRNGLVKLEDGKSFIAYVEKHGTDQSAIYATQNPAKFVAVLDEHPELQAGDPAWREFRAEYTPKHSPEWETWSRMNRQHFESTEKFAYFLEDNAPDIIEPAAAELLEVALNFRVNQDVTYKAVHRLQDGNIDLQYQNNIDAQTTSTRTANTRIPEVFAIEVPIFAGIECKSYRVEARFRFRLHSGALKLWYELVRPHKVVEAAFKDLWTEIGDGTKRDILLGTTD